MNKNYKINILIILLLIILLHTHCIHRKKSTVVYTPKEATAIAKSFNGVAKLIILDKGKKISAKMNYCYNAEKQYYINDIRGTMNINLGYLVMTSKEMFLYLSKQNAYLKVPLNEENFERIFGIKLMPFAFIRLFTGSFECNKKEKKYELMKGDSLFRYYALKDQWLVEQIYIKRQLLKALHFYHSDKRYATINLLYSNKVKEPIEINVLINKANLKINIKIEKQNIIDQLNCKTIDLSTFAKGQPIKLDEYSSDDPLLLYITE